MKRIIGMLTALCLMAACFPASAEDAPSTGKPWANPNLYDAFPERPGPEENYYIFANYDRFVRAASGAGANAFSLEMQIDEQLSDQFLDICRNTEYTDTESEILRILYALASDTERRKRESLADLMLRVDRVKAVRTTEELTELMREEAFLLGNPFFSVKLQLSAENPEITVMSINKNPILDYLPFPIDPTEEEMANGPQLDRETPRRGLLLMRYGEEEADRIIDELERYDNWFGSGEPDWLDGTSSTMVSLRQIRENCPPLYAMLYGTGFIPENNETGKVYEIGPNCIGAFTEWYTEDNLETLKGFVALSLFESAKEYQNLEEYARGTYDDEDAFAKQKLVRQIRFNAVIPANQAYVTHYCPEEKWTAAVGIFEDVREALRERIRSSEWLGEESKRRSLEKLDDLVMGRIVPPGGSFDCTELLEQLRECESFTDAAAICSRFDHLCTMRFAGEKQDRTNPYANGTDGILALGGKYIPEMNIFNIGASALSGFMCDFTSTETLYGSLGCHIAHEVSHGYDFIGARMDVTRKAPLFTEEDFKRFTEKSMAVAAQLSRIETGNGVMLPGEQVIYEAMADMTGMTLMLDLAGKMESFDYDAFFRSAAGIFFVYEAGDDNHPRADGSVDSHPPYYVRINFTVARFDEFYRAYPSVTEGTPMYAAPEDRILVW